MFPAENTSCRGVFLPLHKEILSLFEIHWPPPMGSSCPMSFQVPSWPQTASCLQLQLFLGAPRKDGKPPGCSATSGMKDVPASCRCFNYLSDFSLLGWAPFASHCRACLAKPFLGFSLCPTFSSRCQFQH